MSFGLSLMMAVGIFTASLGLNLSSLTLLSGHSLSKRLAKRRLRRLVLSFILGIVVMSFLFLSTLSLFIVYSPFGLELINQPIATKLVWSQLLLLLSGQILLMLGLSLYFRKYINPWTAPGIKQFLIQRASQTRSSVEAFSLGMMSFLGNWLILSLPLTILAYSLLDQMNLVSIFLFSLLNAVPCLIIYGMISYNQKISAIHRFLIQHANFLKTISLLSLALIGLVIYAYKIFAGPSL